MASRGPKLVCEECGEDVRLYSLVENDGMFIGCGCNDVKHSEDSMPYELGVSDTSDDWIVAESWGVECDHAGTDLPEYDYCPYCGVEL